MRRCITIYTDASVCSNTQIGGWACWIKTGPGETSLFAGAFKTPVKCTTDAELRAIANGLAHAVKLFPPRNCSIVVVTDSQGAIDVITGKAPNFNKPKRKNFQSDAAFEAKLTRYNQRQSNVKIGEAIKKMIPSDCELKVNKVKGHSKAIGPRTYVNKLVDKACRKAMRTAREEKAS